MNGKPLYEGRLDNEVRWLMDLQSEVSGLKVVFDKYGTCSEIRYYIDSIEKDIKRRLESTQDLQRARSMSKKEALHKLWRQGKGE